MIVDRHEVLVLDGVVIHVDDRVGGREGPEGGLAGRGGAGRARRYVGRTVRLGHGAGRDVPGRDLGEVGGDAARGGDAGRAVHRPDHPAALVACVVRDVAEHDVVLAVAIQIPDADEGPVEAGREVGRRVARAHGAAVHRIPVPGAARVADQHVVLAISIQVGKAGETPRKVGRQTGHKAVPGRGQDDLATAHPERVVAPLAVGLVPEQQVAVAVAVQIARADDLPGRILPGDVRGQPADRTALGGVSRLAVHHVVEPPARLRVAQQHVWEWRSRISSLPSPSRSRIPATRQLSLEMMSTSPWPSVFGVTPFIG